MTDPPRLIDILIVCWAAVLALLLVLFVISNDAVDTHYRIEWMMEGDAND